VTGSVGHGDSPFFPPGFRPNPWRLIPEDALAAQRARDEREARLQGERDEQRAQALERERAERARPVLEAGDEQFRERAERLLNVAGLRREVTALRGELAELRKALGR